MLFNVESDTGSEIVGYLVPDGFTGQPTIVVTSGAEDLLRRPTWVLYEALVAAGRHETGLCGFRIDEENVPGLGTLDDLEIRDAETDLIIYRRVDPDVIVRRKIFRLEVHLLPLFRLDRALGQNFQFSFPSVERFGLETVNQVFLMNNSASINASGRVTYSSVQYYVDSGFDCVSILHDPFSELAERLLVLRAIGHGSANFLSLRDNVSLEATIAFAKALDVKTDKGLRRSFRELEPDVAAVLSDPVVRQLTTRLPDEQLKPSSISRALSTLSSFKVVGLRRHPELFAQAVAEELSLDYDNLPRPHPIPAVEELSSRLREIPSIERILEHDLSLYQLVSEAFEKSFNDAI